jgi:hypothetical protein
MSFAIAADLVLLVHFLVVMFVVGGLLVVWLGNQVHWRWVNGWFFRVAHAGAIGFIVIQAWLGQQCPLTHLERWLREQAGESVLYQASFIQHWVETLLYFEGPLWVFALVYTLFGLLVAITWWRYPPGH